MWSLSWGDLVRDFTMDAGAILVLGFVGVLFASQQGMRVVLLLTLCFLGLACFGGTSQALLSSLRRRAESQIHAAQSVRACEAGQGLLVVLGGGIWGTRLPSVATHSRALAAAEWLTRRGLSGGRIATRVVLSGGVSAKDFPADAPTTEAQLLHTLVVQQLPRAWPLPESYLETRSLNTQQNALYVRELSASRALPNQIFLVTSDVHIPRAVRLFRSQGFVVCPVLAASPDLAPRGVFSFHNARLSLIAFREFAGFSLVSLTTRLNSAGGLN